MKAIMQQLGAIDLASDGNSNLLQPDATQALAPERCAHFSGAQTDSASTQQPAAPTALPQGTTAVGWGLSIFSYAEEAWVQGQVLSWNCRQGQHHVLYEDGEDEWLKLGEEHLQWHHSKCNISQRAGLQKGALASKHCSYPCCFSNMGIGKGGRGGREGVVQGRTHMPSNGLASLTCLLVCCGFAVEYFALLSFAQTSILCLGLRRAKR